MSSPLGSDGALRDRPVTVSSYVIQHVTAIAEWESYHAAGNMTQQNAVRIPQGTGEREGFNRERKILLYLCHSLVVVITQIWDLELRCFNSYCTLISWCHP